MSLSAVESIAQPNTGSGSALNQRPPRLLSPRLIEDLLIHPVRSPSRKAHALRRVCQALCQAHGIVPIVHGNLPTEPAILVANHLGYIDPIAICSVAPAIPIAKQEVRDWPLLGGAAARYGTMFVGAR